MRLTLLLSLALVGVAICRVPAQEVVLRLHPRVGDTLHTRLEQQTDVSGTMRDAGGMKPVTTSVTVNSRTIVQSSLPASTIVLTVVDSADLKTTDVHADAQVAEAERALRGKRMLLRLAADGTMESAEDPRGGSGVRETNEAMAAMPAVFPHKAVRPGDQWTREMPLPAGGPLGTRGAGHVNASFRLDSLDRAGNLAFISVRGDVRPDGAGEGMQLTGSILGAMQVDLRRGWMTDSRFVVTMRSLVTPPPESGFAPMRLVTRVTQRLRTMDKR